MENFFSTFFLSFIPLFVAIDALGILPLFISMTDGLEKERRLTLVTQVAVTALGVSVIFLFTGKLLFSFLGITENDFRIAGGIVLLVIAIVDIAFSAKKKRREEDTYVGVVPIGIPLIIGPAALTTILMLVDIYGYVMTLLSLLANLAFVWFIFRHSEQVTRVIGEAGSKALARIMALFLAAIAVMIIRIGLTNILQAQ